MNSVLRKLSRGCKTIIHFCLRHIPGPYNPARYLRDAVWDKYSGVIPFGPFAGMRLPKAQLAPHLLAGLVPKLLGIYEMELWPVTHWMPLPPLPPFVEKT